MKVLHTIQGMTTSLGGPTTCTHDLINAMYKECPGINLLTVDAPDTNEEVLGKSEPWLRLVPYDLKTPIQWSGNLRKYLEKNEYDIYHTNGLWAFVNHETCRIARRNNKPYIISPHGMLYPTALKRNFWKKQPMLKLWFNHDIKSATCIHATCPEEAMHIRNFGYKGPIAVIPNPVVIPEYARLAEHKSHGRKKIGFLGRLHPIKKIEQVLYAMALLNDAERSELCFQIIGKDDERYESWLMEETRRLNLERCVEFLGFVRGKEKYRLLQELWALMVPSVQENFGMIVPEALICGTPVYASLGTPWNILSESGCGWWRDNSPETIVGILREILGKTEDEILKMGRIGRAIITRNYSDNIVADKMWQLYMWITGNTSTPDFVCED